MTDEQLYFYAEAVDLPKTSVQTMYYGKRDMFNQIASYGIDFPDGYVRLHARVCALQLFSLGLIEYATHRELDLLSDIFKSNMNRRTFGTKRNCIIAISSFSEKIVSRPKYLLQWVVILEDLYVKFKHLEKDIDMFLDSDYVPFD